MTTVVLALSLTALMVAMTFIRASKSSGVAKGELPCVTHVNWSPNKSSRGSSPVTTLVWHYTAGIGKADVWFANPEAKASSHFVIRRNGDIVQCVKLADAAWHTGNSTVGNSRTIGVELENVGRVYPDDGGWTYGSQRRVVSPDVLPERLILRFPSGASVDGWWVGYTTAQKIAIQSLIRDLNKTVWRTCLEDQRGHEDIATPEGRKIDPGPLFPWHLIESWKIRNHKTKVVKPTGEV